MREVAVVGVGMTKFGVHEETSVELFTEAAWEAIDDAGLQPSDMEALFFGNCLGDFSEGQLHMASFAAAAVGLPVTAPTARFEAACATATVAFRHAALLVAAGVYDVALVGGVERCLRMGTDLATRTFAMASESYYEGPTGITFPSVFAMATHLYAAKYGLELAELKKHMANVAVKAHRHGALNPLAQFQKEIGPEKVLGGPMIADPLQLFDCCPFSDGATAAVVVSADKARELGGKPVWVAGMGQGSRGSLYSQKDITVVGARIAASQAAFKQAGVGPADIDMIELHDCFTIAEILALEAIGFYGFGQAYDAASKGDTTFGGKVVVNPSGGLKAKGHPIGATGTGQVYEIVKQLRGECGNRQVEGAKIGMVDTLGGDLGTVCNLILKN